MELVVSMPELIQCVSEAVDLVSPVVQNHHRRVMRIAYEIANAGEIRADAKERLLIAASLHDVGALSVRQRIEIMQFETQENKHACYGARMLSLFHPFRNIAPIVKHHHTKWKTIQSHAPGWDEIPFESQILSLADRISVFFGKNMILGEVDGILRQIDALSGEWFNPNLVEIFHEIAKRESFWLGAQDASIQPIIFSTLSRNVVLQENHLLELGSLFQQMIDFRSPFTAAHSAGVSTVAKALAELCGFSHDECVLMKLAGDLHDIGKMAIPEPILEKPSGLTETEMLTMKTHAYFSDRLLLGISAFDTVRTWGALHHEKLNGNGYPFRMKGDQLSLGSRIMAVADVFTAITEDRPYRTGMTDSTAHNVLKHMADENDLDEQIVRRLFENFDEINALRVSAQDEARKSYNAYLDDLNQ